jgi:hypothetical protein
MTNSATERAKEMKEKIAAVSLTVLGCFANSTSRIAPIVGRKRTTER